MRVFRTLLATGLAFAASTALAADDIGLELNKLEATAEGCRIHVVVANGTPKAFDKYVLDLVMFDKDGVVARRAAVDVSPVRASKTSVYAFNVTDLACESFGKVLLNDVTGCGSEAADCTAAVSVSSRAGIDLIK